MFIERKIVFLYNEHPSPPPWTLFLSIFAWFRVLKKSVKQTDIGPPPPSVKFHTFFSNETCPKLEWRNWQSKFDIYVKGSTEGGRPTEHLRQTSLQRKLDAFWQDKITLSCNKEMDDITCKEIFDEISRTIRITHQVCTTQADLFRIYKADGRSAAR